MDKNHQRFQQLSLLDLFIRDFTACFVATVTIVFATQLEPSSGRGRSPHSLLRRALHFTLHPGRCRSEVKYENEGKVIGEQGLAALAFGTFEDEYEIEGGSN